MEFPIKSAARGETLVIELNCPERGNALSQDMTRGLRDVIEGPDARRARLIVFRGAGRHLCTGFDLAGIEEVTDGDLLLRFVEIEELLQAILRLRSVTLAVASGSTTGAGADLFLCCDKRICLPDTRFSFPGSGFNLILGTHRLARLVGADVFDSLISMSSIDTQAALEMGLVTHVVECEAIPAFIGDLAKRLEEFDGGTIAQLREACRQSEADRELAALVRSAAKPGLKSRILEHRRRVTEARAHSRARDV